MVEAHRLLSALGEASAVGVDVLPLLHETVAVGEVAQVAREPLQLFTLAPEPTAIAVVVHTRLTVFYFP